MEKIILTIVTLLIITATTKLYTSRKEVEKEEEKMLKELKKVRSDLKGMQDLFSCIGGYNNFIKYLDQSIAWLNESYHLKPCFEHFREEFKTAAQEEHKNFLVSCLTLYPKPYFIPKEKYFGKFSEVDFIYE